MAEHEHPRATNQHGLREYLAVLARRKWWVISCALAVPAVAVATSLQQRAQYEASATVILNGQDLPNTLTGTQNPVFQDPQRVAATQAEFARANDVARRVVSDVRVSGLTIEAFLSRSGVDIVGQTDVLRFHVKDHDPALARRLTTTYATAYIQAKREVDTAAIRAVRVDVEQHLRQLEAAGKQNAPLYTTLSGKDEQLRTLEALQSSSASIIGSPDSAAKVAPRPVRNGLLGLLLGIVIGLGLAFAREALDTRIRSTDELSRRLAMPLLSRIPEPARKLRKDDELVTLAKPSSHDADAFRVLRTNLAFVNHAIGAKVIMVTSAVEREGKSTTIANLAVSLARAGHRVALVDLDLRRPYIDRFFRLPSLLGVTDVALGQARLDTALARVGVGDAASSLPATNGNTNGDHAVSAFVHVLAAGTIPPDPGEVVGWPAIGEILQELSGRMDYVLVDSPPLLSVGDPMTLSAHVDAVFLVLKSTVVRRPMVAEVRRQLDTSSVVALGFVLTQSESEEGYAYGDGYRYQHTPKAREADREALTT